MATTEEMHTRLSDGVSELLNQVNDVVIPESPENTEMLALMIAQVRDLAMKLSPFEQ